MTLITGFSVEGGAGPHGFYILIILLVKFTRIIIDGEKDHIGLSPSNNT